MIIGVTGSSGSGKTTLCKIAEENFNSVVINSDNVVKQLKENFNSDYYKSIVNLFGKQILHSDNKIDNKKLSQIIYNNKIMREKLNEITFNYVVKEIRNILSKLDKEKNIFIDAPLLYESGLDKDCDIVIAIVADKNEKLSRINRRDNIDINIAKERLDIQKDDEFYKNKTKFIIYNNGNLNDLEKSLERILVENEKVF